MLLPVAWQGKKTTKKQPCKKRKFFRFSFALTARADAAAPLLLVVYGAKRRVFTLPVTANKEEWEKLELGIPVAVLQKLLNHFNITETMVDT